MKIDFSTVITDLSGAPVVDGDKPLVLGKLAVEALLAVFDAGGRPEQLTGEEKVKFASLAERIFSATEPLDIPVEDVARIKGRIGKGYGALIVMRAWSILEGGQ